MQDSDRAAFEVSLAEVFAAIDKPLGEAQRNVFWKGLKDLGLVEFARICDFLVRQYREYEQAPKKFTLGDIWSARKRLRAASPKKDLAREWKGDEWDEKANFRLLGYVLRKAYARQKISPEATWILVEHKNRWATLMRASGDFEAIEMRDQDAAWIEVIRTAEQEIARDVAA